jgi:DtxR family Mn-dependent transcriptional regulator
MIKKLVDKQLIDYEKSKGVKLTQHGLHTAVQIVRKHRLWEVFLLEKLGYTWDEVHEIAEQLEHIQHPDLADKLDKFLDYPQFDPHGDPIPQSNGKLPVVNHIVLEHLEVGMESRVVGVKDTTTAFLQYLKQLNVAIGTVLEVTERIPFDGSLQLLIDRTTKQTVSQKFAENILVRG